MDVLERDDSFGMFCQVIKKVLERLWLGIHGPFCHMLSLQWGIYLDRKVTTDFETEDVLVYSH